MARQPRNTSGDNADAGQQTDNGGSTTVGAGTGAGFATITIDPADISASGAGTGSNSGDGGNTTGEPVRKRRGRKPGSTNKAKNPPLDIKGIELILLSTHNMLAALTNTPALALDNEEAEQLATATANVARHYDVSATEKTVDWIALMMALGAVYGPRLMLLQMNRKSKKQPQANGADTEQQQPMFGGPVHVPGAIQ